MLKYVDGEYVKMTTSEIYSRMVAAQAEAMSGTVQPTYQDVLDLLPITMPDGTVTTLGDAVANGGTAPFELLSKWVLVYDNGFKYERQDDPTGIGSIDNPFIGDDIPQTSWPLKDGAYYKVGDTMVQYVVTAGLTGTSGKFVEA